MNSRRSLISKGERFMIKEIANINFIKLDLEDSFKTYRTDIEEFWDTFHRTNPDSYSEKLLNVFDISEDEQGYTLSVDWINFYEALYSKHTENIKTRPLFSAGYVITCDGYYCLAVDANGNINLIGGVSSVEDMEDSKFVPELCLIREFQEEIGVDIQGEDFTYELKYIKAPEGNEIYFPVGLIYQVRTKFTKDELENIFRNSAHDNELQSIKFLTRNEKEIFRHNTRRPYINELFDLMNLK